MMSVFVVRAIYLFFEVAFDFDILAFFNNGHSWFVTIVMSVCVVGFVEEFVKASVGLSVAHKMDSEKNSSLLFMACAGSSLGFSVVENFQYYKEFGLSVLALRTFVSSSAHLFFVIVSAVLIAQILAKVNSDYKKILLIPFSVFIAAIFHGTFNYFVFYTEMATMNATVLALALVFLLGVYEAWIYLIRKEENYSFALTTCIKCRIIAFSKAKYCAFCGNKVNVLRKTTLLNSEDNSAQLLDNQDN